MERNMISLSRRSFVQALCASGAASPMLAACATMGPFFQTQNLPIGIQLYTLSDMLATNLEGAVSAVATHRLQDGRDPVLHGQDAGAAARTVRPQRRQMHRRPYRHERGNGRRPRPARRPRQARRRHARARRHARLCALDGDPHRHRPHAEPGRRLRLHRRASPKRWARTAGRSSPPS